MTGRLLKLRLMQQSLIRSRISRQSSVHLFLPRRLRICLWIHLRTEIG